MTKKGYNYLVLMDFSEASYIALKYIITVAKVVKGNIHVLHIANPEKIIGSENAVVVLREITDESEKIESKLTAIVEIIEAEGVDAQYQFFFVKKTRMLRELIGEINPDLIVVGKKKEKPKFSGRFTSFLQHKYSGSVLIISKEAEFQPDTQISMECYNAIADNHDPKMAFELDKHTDSEILLIPLDDLSKPKEEFFSKETWRSLEKKIQKLRLEGSSDSERVIRILKHLLVNKTELLCIGRGERKTPLHNFFFGRSSTISKIVKEVNIPILILDDD